MIILRKLDYHIHSRFSDGQPTYREILDRAKALGLSEVAITDHFDKFDENVRTQSITDDELLDYFNEVKEYGCRIGQKVLCGIETCTDFYGRLRLSDRVIQNCDLIITSPHYVEYSGNLTPGDYFNESYWERYKEKVLNMAEGEGDILGHCEAYLPYGRLLPNSTTYEERQNLARNIASKFFNEDYISEMIRRLKKSGKAVEMHCITQTPREWVIAGLIRHKVMLSLGSDAHMLDNVGNVEWGRSMLEKLNGDQLLFKKD